MAGANLPLTFRIFKGDEFLREETLSQPVIKVGKLSSSHLRLEDESVSRMHAVIEVGGDEVSIIDLGSTKGTIVNGQKVNKAKLQHGDEIVLGDLRIELGLGAEAGVSAPVSSDASDDDVTRVDQTAAPAADLPAALPPLAAPPLAAPPLAAPPLAAPPLAAPPIAPPAPAPRAPAPLMTPPPAAAAPIAPARAPAPPRAPAPAMPAAAPLPRTAAPVLPTAPPAPVAAAPVAPPPSVARPSAVTGPPVGFGGGDDFSGAGAVEVAAMLGDSVVGVKHVMNPRGGKITSLTYGLFAVGAALLVLSAISFVIGVQNSAKNEHALKQHTEVDRLPIGEFRPSRLSLGWDFTAFGGAAGGLLCCIFGLMRYRDEQVQPFFRIGSAPDVDFPTDAAPVPSFPMIAPEGDDFVFNYGPQMTGEMTVGGTSTPLDQLPGSASASAPGGISVRIPPNARFRVTSGQQTFLVSAVSPPRKQAVPLFASIESNFLGYLGGSAIVFLGLIALLYRIPPDSSQMSSELMNNENLLSRMQDESMEDPKQEEEEEDDGEDVESGGTGTKMMGDEGKMGKKESTRQSGQYAMKNNDAPPQLAKEQQLEAARSAGVLGVVSQLKGGAFAAEFADGAFSSGLDDQDVYGGLLGNEVGEMQGGFGYGTAGVGPGGGGTGWGTIGTGKYGTIGHGSGTGDGYGSGSGRGGMRGRKALTPQVRIGNATANGDLDKNIIRRYIRRRKRQIQNCYERELLVKPKLAGTVVTQFMITPSGAVQSASARGMGSKKVESCVAGVIRGIKFPAPKNGGRVNVRYPFIFRAAGG